MPIKPENRKRYPSNWPAIREAVRQRSGDCCEGSPDFPDCRRPNGWLLNKRTGELTDDSQIAGTWELDGDKVVHEERLLKQRQQRIRDVRQGPEGALYVLVDAEDGMLLKITP